MLLLLLLLLLLRLRLHRIRGVLELPLLLLVGEGKSLAIPVLRKVVHAGLVCPVGWIKFLRSGVGRIGGKRRRSGPAPLQGHERFFHVVGP